MSNKRRRITCVRKYPTNELFKFWIEELRDKALSNGSKTHYVYGKALASLRACPLELATAEDAKKLDNVGPTTVKVLSDKLRQFVEVHGEPTLENIRLAGVAIDLVRADDNDNGSAEKTRKKPARRQNAYIPKYRSGGYAIIRALYDAYLEEGGEASGATTPCLGKKELQIRAQPYCDESLTTATRDNPYTAWNSVNTLTKHDLVRMNRAGGSSIAYTLTEAGLEMGKRLTEAAEAPDSSMTSPSHNATSPAKAGVKTPIKKASPRKRRKSFASPPVDGASTSTSLGEYSKQRSPSSPSRNLPSPPNLDVSNNYFHDVYDPGFTDDPGFDHDIDGGFGQDNDYGFGQVNDPEPIDHQFGYGSPTRNFDVAPEVRCSQDHSGAPAPDFNNGNILEYIYVNPDGGETKLQEKAYIMIDESTGCLWYLVKTTDAYLRQTGPEQWRECGELPQSLAGCNLDNGEKLMFLSEAYAPDILENNDAAACSNGGTSPDQAPTKIITDTQPGVRSTCDKSENENGADLASDDLPSTSGVRAERANAVPSKEDSSWKASQASTSKSNNARAPSCRELIVLEPFTFEIILVVDHAEVVGGVAMNGEARNRKAFLIEGLDELKVSYIQAKLAVGDYLFIAREKNDGVRPSGGKEALSGRELVLGPVIERKRMDDLAASIRDGRFHEQKMRLHSCGVEKVFYLVEAYGKSMDTFGMKEAALRSAFIGTQVVDQFAVTQKKNPHESAVYLFNILSFLREQFLSKRLISRQPDSLTLEQLLELGADEIALPTFQEFQELSSKRRPLTVGDAFARCLLQFPGVSPERADAIRKVYPTLSHLLDAYEACDGDEATEEALLAGIQYGQLRRNIGKELSKKIARFFCAKERFTI